MAASAEQQAIITALGNGSHVYADAVAGSGKTTTVLWMARQYPQANIIQVTYNSQLKNEVRDKAAALNLNNIKIHTYHSLVCSFYDPTAHTDIVMSNVVYSDAPLSHPIPKIDIFVIDEAQDMTPLFYSMIQKFLKDAAQVPAPRILVIGDRFQGVYAFKLADTRFLTLAPLIYPNIGAFTPLTLSQSYRVTVPMAEFVNKVLVGRPRIQSMRPSNHLVGLIKCNIYSREHIKQIVDIILDFARQAPDDVFILAPSIRSDQRRPPRIITQLENALVRNGVPCYVPPREEGSMDEKVIRGKVCLTTFHQSKGRERKYVFVLGFDQGYMEHFAADLDPRLVPPTIYVACTRATERLFVIQHKAKALPSFIRAAPDPYVNTIDLWPDAPPPSPNPSPSRDDRPICYNPAELIRFLNEKELVILQEIMDGIITTTTPIQTPVVMPSVVTMFGPGSNQPYYEEVADLNGLAIPAMFEAQYHSHPEIHLKVLSPDMKDPFIKFHVSNLPKRLRDPADFLYAANIYQSLRSAYHFKLKQIRNYTWLKPKQCKKCMEYMAANVKIPFKTEIGIASDFAYRNRDQTKIRKYEIYGCLDADDGETIWEYKCVDYLTLDHQLQLAIYAYIYTNTPNSPPRAFKLLNIRTGEVQTLALDQTQLKRVITTLFRARNREIRQLEDSEFVKKMIKRL